MNKFSVFLFGLSILGMLIVASCGSRNGTKPGGGTKKYTSFTGWKPNDAKGWFFSPNPQKRVDTWDNMVFVEGGTFVMGQVKDDVLHDWNNTPRRMQVRSFNIGETEVTNYDYKSYLTWLKVVFPPSTPEYRDIYYGSLPDSLVWSNKLSRNDIYAETYLRSPQYDFYPVVGVSWLQAQNYCEWLTDRANERELMNKGILSRELYENDAMNIGSKHFQTDTYKYNDSNVKEAIDTARLAKVSNIRNQNQRVQKANRSTAQNLIVDFRLPTEAEWEYAALGLAAQREYNQYKGKPVVQNEIRKTDKGRGRGDYLGNFKRGRGDYSGIGGWGNDDAAITNDVRKYPSNDIGIYGMNGNVAEWVQDVYRPIIDDEANDFNYFRGNVYKGFINNDQGGFARLEDNEIQFDTLNDGRRTYRQLPGEYKEVVLDDARNFRDGDLISSLEVGQIEDESEFKGGVYNAPKRQFRVDENGRVIIEKDTKQRTTLVSDETRVVKGGSWKDPLYWLDPGQRRYMHQASSTDWIGFRVAQDHLGSDDNGQGRKARN